MKRHFTDSEIIVLFTHLNLFLNRSSEFLDDVAKTSWGQPHKVKADELRAMIATIKAQLADEPSVPYSC